MSQNNSIVRQDINFLENPLWSPDRQDNRHVYQVKVENGVYIFTAMPGDIPDDTDALFLYYFIFNAQKKGKLNLEFETIQILKELGFAICKRNYDRLYKSLDRWKKASADFKGCFFKKEKDNKTGKEISVYIDKGFHFLEYEIKKEKKEKSIL
jgi:hypothetical protein